MIYFSPRIAPAEFGYIASPAGQIGVRHLTRVWGCDNQVFTKKFDPVKFFRWLRFAKPYRETCKFVVAPDVVGDCTATLRQYEHFAGAIRALGYPVAFAAQDGQESYPLPIDYDCLFVGGSTGWKLSPASIGLIRHAQTCGKWIHVGRVNGLRRIGHCLELGVDSVDGTHPCFEPDVAFRNIHHWMRQGVIFSALPLPEMMEDERK